MSRQAQRREFFELSQIDVNGANVLREGDIRTWRPTAYVLSRKERRNLARAYAAKLWRERFAEQKAA